ncbi:hypothetical protein VPNG_06640 [Cytospora leucostoma]|uniref:AA1-like domain-containing protein n=1 Tax=Cytospora leucostoma TaxID=1230097 RepID=A0A423WUP5_9PEZI|nr:hypothetical protein VPNG_06640 [Cytospora leucostoma]
MKSTLAKLAVSVGLIAAGAYADTVFPIRIQLDGDANSVVIGYERSGLGSCQSTFEQDLNKTTVYGAEVYEPYTCYLFASADCSDDPTYFQVTGGSGPMYPDQSITWQTFRCDAGPPS